MDSSLLLSYKEAARVGQTLCAETNLFSYVLGSFLSVRHTLQKTSKYKWVRFWEWRWRNRIMWGTKERKRARRSMEWNWMTTFCYILFCGGGTVVCMDVTNTEVCVLYASSSKAPRDSWASMSTCFCCNYVGGWIGRLGGGFSNALQQPQHRHRSVCWSSSINVWEEFIYTRAGC